MQPSQYGVPGNAGGAPMAISRPMVHPVYSVGSPPGACDAWIYNAENVPPIWRMNGTLDGQYYTTTINHHSGPIGQSIPTPPSSTPGDSSESSSWQPIQNLDCDIRNNTPEQSAAENWIRIVTPDVPLLYNASASTCMSDVVSPQASSIYGSSPAGSGMFPPQYTYSYQHNLPMGQGVGYDGSIDSMMNSLSHAIGQLLNNAPAVNQPESLIFNSPTTTSNQFGGNQRPDPLPEMDYLSFNRPLHYTDMFSRPPPPCPLTIPILGSDSMPQVEPSRVAHFRVGRSELRNRLLEQFRNNRLPNLQLGDIIGHVVEFSQDQLGSRFVQLKLEKATLQEKHMVFQEVMSSCQVMVTDIFGNYVIQKFFEFGTEDQTSVLIGILKSDVVNLALHIHGCRVLQAALHYVSEQKQQELIAGLDGFVLQCAKDQNGNHVIQKVIEVVHPMRLHFVIDSFIGSVFMLSTHRLGCRVIQRIVEHCNTEQQRPILDELLLHTQSLVVDEYGNYVVQHILEHGIQRDKSKIITEILGNILRFSKHKLASNVVEKCVCFCTFEERRLIIAEVLVGGCNSSTGTTSSTLLMMMTDKYANYVVQRMLGMSDEVQRELIMQKIKPVVPALRKCAYGKHIITKLEQYFSQKAQPLRTSSGLVDPLSRRWASDVRSNAKIKQP